jgi:hypothetical protein
LTWILQRLADAGLVKGKTIGVDATTLEANGPRSIVRRDTGATYQEFLTQLAQALAQQLNFGGLRPTPRLGRAVRAAAMRRMQRGKTFAKSHSGLVS